MQQWVTKEGITVMNSSNKIWRNLFMTEKQQAVKKRDPEKFEELCKEHGIK